MAAQLYWHHGTHMIKIDPKTNEIENIEPELHLEAEDPNISRSSPIAAIINRRVIATMDSRKELPLIHNLEKVIEAVWEVVARTGRKL